MRPKLNCTENHAVHSINMVQSPLIEIIIQANYLRWNMKMRFNHVIRMWQALKNRLTLNINDYNQKMNAYNQRWRWRQRTQITKSAEFLRICASSINFVRRRLLTCVSKFWFWFLQCFFFEVFAPFQCLRSKFYTKESIILLATTCN